MVLHRTESLPPGVVQTIEGFPLGGSWHGGAVTDEGAGLGQLSFRRHLIRFASLTTFPSRGRLSRVRCKPANPDLTL